ncbi:3'(2'),5'-bisphosphate nucleotidase CysQ [Parahaliea aestuarii]|uniref:3'(2'),5'-bisphosphate nucleotidase CysQ n=1 Tax=Parahaliea aestuarii TaxID=1852021 RepID=A0A5C9A0Z8_9GAMM|nr:3'(2'),5'-bisphosphate nucleotidase CysQ [Parahaliea aestuarii]TXS94543.1 3'(2'),5'-bisphosphate nucleotidase CysQ [Parahaliea aestuarii]
MNDLSALIPPLLTLSQQAGEAICLHYHAPGDVEVESKHDDSPLTRADLDSHVILREGLRTLAGGLPVLSEESSPQTKSLRRDWPRYWLVDPLDGTKEFVAGTGEFTVNIALIDEHRPVLGVLYQPLARLAYVGIPGTGAWRYAPTGSAHWQGEAIHTRHLREGRPLSVLASRRHRGERLRNALAWLEQAWGPLERHNSGSALKFCHLAEGEGDFYPRYSPCCEWDVAAGQALVEGAGGAVLGLDGDPLRYNLRDTLLSAPFLAIAAPGHALWRRYQAELAE